MNRKYVLLSPDVRKEYDWAVHAVGCSDITRELRERGGSQETLVFDLDDPAACMKMIDVDNLGYDWDEHVKVFPCARAAHKTPIKHKPPRPQKAAAATSSRTGTRTPAKPARPVATKPAAPAVPTTKPKANGTATDAAKVKAEQIMAGIIEKIIARRGDDTVGEGDQWADQRRAGVDDYTYDLAIEVRKAREAGGAWWRIAHDLELPGAGPSAAQGKSGAAYARRLWERAWGKTYGDGERAPRETKQVKRERAITTEGRPFFAEDALEPQIISALCGQTIYWNARLGDQLGGVIVAPQETMVHHDPRTIKVRQGPKGRYVEFYEQIDPSMAKVDPHKAIATTGPLRSIYLNRIERVGR